MKELLRRVGYLWSRRRMEREMAEEMAYHRELLAREGRTDFGSELRLREDAREVWGWGWLDRARQDLRYGARTLRRSPGFTATATLVLALGIGLPLTAFRMVLVDAEASSGPDPDTLVRLTRRAPGSYSTKLPYPELEFFAANAHSFREVMAVSDRHLAVFGEGTAEPVRVTFLTTNYLREFGIRAVAGRGLTAGDERADAEPVAMFGELFWQRRFGGDAAAIGRLIRVNGKPVRIVGVVPRSAKSVDEIWMPLLKQPYVVEGSALLTDWNSALDGYARLQAGVSAQAARAESAALAARLHEARPEQVWRGEYLDARPILEFSGDTREFQTVLTASLLVLLLLVAACANLGTLVLARGVAREREIRTRMALGAGRMRVVRQLFTEAVLLAMLSGGCALLLSTAAIRVIQVEHNSTAGVWPDWRTLSATFGAALVAALVFGLPPALRLTSLVPRAGRARTVFLSVQVAVSCLLLVVSSLLVNGLGRLSQIEPGFDYRHAAWIAPGLKAHGYGGPAARAYLDALRARALKLPGVQGVSAVWLAPWGDSHMGSVWLGRQFAGNRVDAEFLKTMGMRLARGRNFLPDEQGVALISEAMERVLWPEGDAMGKPLPWDPRGPVVVGIVRNASTSEAGNPATLEFYLPLTQNEVADAVLVVRTARDPRVLMHGLQDAARTLDGRLQPAAQTVAESYDREVERLSRGLAVISALGLVAILLSGIGLAGLAGYTVAQRTREIGLRIALGARPGQVVRAMLAPMSRPIAAGFACGALGGAAVGTVLRNSAPSMANLNVLDPRVYLLAMGLFGVVVGLAILAPGRRAVRIDPARALQHE